MMKTSKIRVKMALGKFFCEDSFGDCKFGSKDSWPNLQNKEILEKLVCFSKILFSNHRLRCYRRQNKLKQPWTASSQYAVKERNLFMFIAAKHMQHRIWIIAMFVVQCSKYMTIMREIQNVRLQKSWSPGQIGLP